MRLNESVIHADDDLDDALNSRLKRSFNFLLFSTLLEVSSSGHNFVAHRLQLCVCVFAAACIDLI